MTHESRVVRFRACRQWFCEYVRRIVLGGDILRRNLRVFKHIVFHKHFLVCDVAGSITICRALADVNRNLIVHLQFCWFVLFESKFIQEFACPEYLLCCKTAGEIFGLCCGEYRSWLNCAFPSKSCTGSEKGEATSASITFHIIGVWYTEKRGCTQVLLVAFVVGQAKGSGELQVFEYAFDRFFVALIWVGGILPV